MEPVQYVITDEMLALEAAVKKQAEEEQKTLYGLIKYFRKNRELGRFITLETTPLNPLVTLDSRPNGSSGSVATVHVLFSSLVAGPKAPQTIPLPWVYLCWEWPSRQLVAVMDLRGLVQLPDWLLMRSDLLDKDFADSVERALGSGEPIPMPSPALQALYGALLDRLEKGDFDPLPPDLEPERPRGRIEPPKHKAFQMMLKAPEGPVPPPAPADLGIDMEHAVPEPPADMATAGPPEVPKRIPVPRMVAPVAPPRLPVPPVHPHVQNQFGRALDAVDKATGSPKDSEPNPQAGKQTEDIQKLLKEIEND